MSSFEGAHVGHIAADVEVAHDAGFGRGHKQGAERAQGVGGRHLTDRMTDIVGTPLNKISPLFGSPFNDGLYLRGIFGNAYLILPAIAAVLGFWSVINTGGLAVPPTMWLCLALMVIGVLDAFSGLVGLVVFALGVVFSGHFFSTHLITAPMGHQGMLYALTGLFLNSLLWYIAPQLAQRMRPLVVLEDEKGLNRLHLIAADLVVLPFLTVLVLGSMPALAPSLTGAAAQGLDLVDIQNHIFGAKVAVAITMFIRVMVELLIYRNFAPMEPAYPSSRHPLIERFLKLGTWAFAFGLIWEVMGFMWQTVAVWLIFIGTDQIAVLGERFLRPSSLYRFVPRNLFKILCILIFSQYAMKNLNGHFVSGTDILGWLAIALAIVTVVFALLEGAKRETETVEDLKPTWWTRTAGFVVVLALFLFSQDIVHIEAKSFSAPTGVSLSFAGTTYIADTGNNRVIRIGVDGTRTTLGVGLDRPVAAVADPLSSQEVVYILDTFDGGRLVQVTQAPHAAYVPPSFQIKAFAGGDLGQTTLITGLKDPQDLSVDLLGRIYIADTGHNRIVSYYHGVTSVFTSGLDHPEGVSADVFGHVYVADTGAHRVVKYSVNAKGAVTNSSDYVPGHNCSSVHSAPFAQPTSVAVDLAGNVYVADAGSHKVRQFGVDGCEIPVTGEFEDPVSVSTNLAGHAYIADAGTSEVQVLSPLYTPERLGAVPTQPGTAVALDNKDGSAFVVSASSGTVEHLTAHGRRIIVKAGVLKHPMGVAINALDELYVSEHDTGLIYRVDKNTGALTQIASGIVGITAITPDGYGGLFGVQPGLGNLTTITRDGKTGLLVSGLDNPADVIQDAYGYIDVAISGSKKANGIIEQFKPGGTPNVIARGLKHPNGVAADSNGNIYYIESGTGRIWESMGPLGLQIVSERGVSSKGTPTALASDADGNVYVLQASPNSVYRFILSSHASSI